MNNQKNRRTIPWFLVIIFLFSVTVIIIAGFAFYQVQQERIKSEAQNDLAAIADLKVWQIVQWRRERIADGELICHNVPLLQAFETFMKPSAGADQKQKLQTVMTSYKVKVGYESSVLFDAKGKVRLAVSSYGDSVGVQARSLFQESLRQRKVILSDLHISGPFPLAHIDLMVPLFSPDRHDSTFIGAFMLRIDPQAILFPLIKIWPTPSRTSETLLLKRDGNDIVYLNELRHRKNTALTFRLPISNEQLPASMSVRGIEGTVEGIDYRGVPVLAAIRPIPDSPWYMNAKVDQEEIYTPLRSQAWIVSIGMLLLILSTGSIIGFWWRHQRATFYREKYEAELERKALVTHFDHIIKYANDIIILSNMDGRIVEANDQACRIYGYTREEMFKLNIRDLRTPESISQSEMQIKQVEKQNGMVFESEHRRKNGTVFPVEISSRFIKIDGTRFFQSIIRDITERKHAEELLRENEWRFRALIENISDAFSLIDPDGKILYRSPSARQVVGIPDEEIVNSNMFERIWPEDIDNAKRTFAQILQSPGKCFTFQYRVKNKDGSPRWIEGVGNNLLTDLAVHAIVVNYRDITERKQAMEVLQASEELSRKLISASPEAITIIDANGKVSYVSHKTLEMFGSNYEHEVIGHSALEWIHPKEHEKAIRNITNAFNGIFLPNDQYLLLRKDKSEFNGEFNAALLVDAEKKPRGLIVVIRDITDRKRAEDALRESEERFRRLVESVTDYIYSVKLESGRPISTSHAPACVSVTGYTSEEYASDPDLWYRMVYVEDKEIVRNLTAKILSGFDVLPLEHRIVHKNGSLRWVKNTPVLKRDDKGVLIAFDGLIKDITMQKQGDEALRESEETAHALLNAPNDAAYLLDTERRIIAVNEAGAQRLGKSVDELIGACVDDFISPELVKSRREYINEVFRLCKPVHFEDEQLGMHLENSLYPIFDVQGKVLRIAVFSKDITERIQTEEALRQSESLFKMLVESSPVAIAVFSGPSKKLEYVSSRFIELFGYGHKDMPTMDAWWPLAYPVEEYRNQIKTKWSEAIVQAQREQNEIEPMESVVTCQDGSTKYIESKIASAGKQTLLFFTDLTQRRTAEEELRQTHTFNDLLIQTMPFGMNIVDEEGNILFVSKAMKEMLTVDVIDMCCWTVYKDDNQQCANCPLRKGITFGKPDVIETKGILGGKTFQISHIGMMYEGRKAMMEVFQDITEQKKLQQELVQSQKLLSIGTMAGGIAHDFNNILGIILGYTSILQSIKTNPEKFSDGVNAIKQAVDRGAGLVRQILTFARKTDVSFEPLNVSDLIREIVSMLQQTFPKLITFNTSLDKNMPYIRADHTQIHQAILNLCVNARDAMPNGGEISIHTEAVAGEKLKTRFPSANNSWYICINVSDNGTGIDETVRNQIFDPFFTTKEKGKGTGLGLSVVYGIVQAHNGFIDVVSKMESGTTFSLYFPIPPESSSMLKPNEQVEEQITGGNETLLLVEDETLLLDMLQIFLESNGYTVLIAEDGEDAVNVYKQHAHEIALVISDMGLPKLTGVAEFEKLKEINPDVKIIFASGYFEPNSKAKLENAGVKGFLQKPYVIEEVLSSIRKALDK